jgi:hypothetical protein
MFHMSIDHFVKREGTCDINVHDKELLGVATQDFITEMVKTTSST